MHLEKMELFGFKSFAEKTEFLFDTGLTAVVGPNGCGKSNIVDAIKWVMGEQSVKSLRGAEMADVIFNGTTHRKPLGYAEASLIFSNTKNILPVDFDQVRVTRRLYRTGESEYFMNKARCRLRDIRELFMGTGVANNLYSVIEQGKVDVLLQSNPQERRSIFEEAAGISKYKAKKRTALTKLERVEQNLVRLSDIIAEVQKQMRSLHRQAGKARRYREYSHQLQELKAAYYFHQYQVLTETFERLHDAVEDGQARQGKKQAEIENLEADATRLSTLAIEIEHALRDQERLKAEIDGRIGQAQTEIQAAKERIQDTAETERRCRQEIETTYSRLNEAKSELLQAVTDAEHAEHEIHHHTETLEAIQQETRRLSEEAAQLGRQIQEQRAELIELYDERAGHNNERAALESHSRSLEGQFARARQRREKVHEELAELAMYRRDLEAKVRHLNEKLESCQERLASINQEINQLEESLLSLDERLTEQRDRLTSKEARRQTLQDLERRREGMGAGVKQVLNAIQQQPAQLEGVLGTVAELLQVDVEYAVAIEAALTAAAQIIVTEQTVDTCLAIEFLRKDDRGRATFLPVDRVRANGNGHPPVTNNPSYLGYALNFIEVDERHKPAVAQLLAGTHLVRDFETALNLAPKFPPSARFVTLQGDVVCSSGPITGGGPVDRMGLISRKSELRQLEKELAEIRELMARLSSVREETNRRLEELRDQRETAQAEITDTNLELSEARLQLEQAHRDIDDLEQQDRLLRSEMQDYRQQMTSAENRMTEIARLLEEIAVKESRIQSDLERLDTETKDIDARRESLRETATRTQSSLAALREKLEGLKMNSLRCRRAIQELKEVLVARFDAIDECEARTRTSRVVIAENERAVAQLLSDRSQREQELRQERNRQEEVRTQLERNTTVLREAHTAHRALEEENGELRLQRSEAEMKRQNLIEHAEKELGLNLPEAYQQKDQEEERDWDAIRVDVQALENRIRNLGNVYEDAIEEFEKLELRYQTLTSQEQDLLEAKRKLQEIIRKINKTSRRLFESTFNTVREYFQDLFSKLFGGGKADIFLEEGVDILEAGIEIVARPPGKSQNTVLSLLSGGEKALCTVALLFAIFRARPSPFCILDEVDAPLDESNIDRFVTLVQEFNKRTQFIIITHNRRTMRAADTLYGVTMQEAGVSTRVSVRFEDLEKEIDLE